MDQKKKQILQPTTKENAETKLLEAANIILRLRETTKLWQLHYGSYYKAEMQRWERNADNFLKENIV